MIEIQKNWAYHNVIGVDEVGRGPLAGPVVACAFLLDDVAKLPQEITDSKKLSPGRRKKFSDFLVQNFNYSLGIICNQTIDKINILQATMSAMRHAYNNLSDKTTNFASNTSTIILIDGRDNPLQHGKIISQSMIKGDSKSYAIASASIIAKVYRDELMQQLSLKHPEYGWERNSGYGTKEHIDAIKKHGPTPYHRRSFLKNICSVKLD